MKPRRILSAARLTLPFASALVALLAAPSLKAAVIYWDNAGGTANDWGSLANWSTVVGGGTNPTAIPGTADVATFSATPIIGTAQTINLNADRSVQGLDFLSTLTAVSTLQAGGTNRILTLGTSGITKAGTGAVTIGSATANQNVSIALGADQTWANNNNTGALTIVNGVTSNVAGARTLTLGGTSTASNTVSGIIGNGSGTVSITKSGAGTWVLSGVNTYTGTTTLSAGILSITNASALGTVAAGTTQSGASELRLSNNITTLAEALSINGGGISNAGALRNFSGNNTYAGTVTLAAQSRINSDSGTLTLSAANSVTASNFTLVVGGAGNTTISGIVALGSGGIGKDGAGTLTLSGANTYTGAVTIATGGAITVNNNAALGTTAGGVTVSSGGALQLNGRTVGAEALTLNGTGISNGGALRGLTGTNSYGGAITLGSASRINTDAGTMTVSGAIGGAFGLTVGGAGNTTLSGNIAAAVTSLTKDGTGLLTLSGTNAYGGTSSVTGGVLAFTTTAAIPGYSTSPATAFGTFGSPRITAASGTTVSLPFGGTNSISTTDITGFLDGTYGIFAAGSSLGIDTTNASPSPAVLTTVITDTTAGKLGFTKTGTNALTLGTVNTYTGPTSVADGTMNAGVIGNVGAASGSLGAPTTAADGTISLGIGVSTGTLSYTGAGETTDRVINLAGTTGGGGIDNSGTGTLVFSSPMTFTGAGAKTLTISGASNTTFSAAVLGGGVGQTSPLTIQKNGAGTLLFGATGPTNTNVATRLNIGAGGGIIDIGPSGLTLSNSGSDVITPTVDATINATGGGVLTLSSSGTTNGADIRPAANTTLTINANIATPVSNGSFWTGQGGALELNGAGTLVLTGNNNIGGATIITVANGTISVGSIANNLGGTTGFNLSQNGARLLYTGTGETTAVPIQTVTNTTAIVEQAGPSGTLNFSANWATGAAAKTVTLQGSTAGLGVMSGIISNNSATNTTAITKAGTGRWTLSGANTYTGATNVNGGKLVLTTGSTGNSLVTVNTGATLDVAGNYTIGNTATAAAGGRLTLNAGGTLNLADGNINTLNLVQNSTFVGNAATFAGGSMIFDISASAADSIDVRLNNVAGTGLATSSGSNAISLSPTAGSLGVGNYTLINAAGTLNNSNFFLASPNLVVGGTLYNLSLGLVGTNEVLTVATGGAAASPNVAYWKGTTDASWSLGSAGGVPTNWVVASNGSTDTFAVPGSNTNVILTADTVGTGGLSTTLDQAFTINSLNFTGTNTANTAGSTIAAGTGGTLTIAAAALNGNAAGSGINVLAGSGANTISAPVALGATQTWTNNSTNSLSVAGGISGTGFGLTVVGPGTVALGSSNTFDGPLSIGSGATGGIASISAGGGLGANSTVNLGGTTGAGTLIYTGTAATITHAVNLSGTTGGGVIDQSGTGHLNFTSALTATGVGAKTLTLQGSTAGTGELSGAIVNGSGTTAVTKTGTGTWILSGANTYTGTTTINNGSLKMGSASALSSTNPVTLAGTGTFDLNGNSVTIGALTSTDATAFITNSSAGTGASTATALNTPSGSGVYVDALNTSHDGNVTTAALITDGATRKTQIVITNTNDNARFTNASNSFSGGVVLTNSATGTRLSPGTITGTPYGTGPIIIGQTATDKAGIYFATAGQTLTNDIVFNTALGTDRVGIRTDGAGQILSGKITANLAPATFTANTATAGAFTLTGQVTGASGLVLDITSLSASATAFNVTLNNGTVNPNDYQGNTVINLNAASGKSATLNLGAANQLPNGTGTGNVIINSNETGVGTLNLAGFSDTINGLSGNGRVDGTSGTPTLTVGDNDATATFSGIIRNTAGILSLTKTGTGTQTLSGANTYSGVTSISGGTLAFSAANNLGDGSATNTITLNGGTLSYTGSTSTSLPAAQVVTIGTSHGTLNASEAAGTLNLLGGITTSSAANLTKTGLGTVTVTGSTNLNGGNVTVSGGVLNAGFTATGLGAIDVANAGTLNLYDGTNTTMAISGLTLASGSSLGFDLNGTGVNDILNLTGTASVTAGVSLNFNNLGGLAAGNYDLINVTAGTLTATDYALGLAPSGFNYSFSTINTDQTLRLTTSPLSLRYWTGDQDGSWNTDNGPGNTNWASDLAGTELGALPANTDTLVFSATNANAPGGVVTTSLNNVAVTADSLRFISAPTTPATTAVTVASGGAGGILTINPFSSNNGITVAGLGGDVTISAPVVALANQTWEVNGSSPSSLVVGGDVTFTGRVTKTGAGSLTLSGANSGSGGVNLVGGILNINSNSALGTGIFTIGTGTMIDSTVAGVTIGNAQAWDGNYTFTGTNSLNLGTGNVTLGANAAITASANTLTVGGVIDDGASTFGLTKAGAGTLVLGGNNTYTGVTTISGGVLRITKDSGLGTIGSGTSVANGSALELDGTGGDITVGTEALTLNGGGITNLGALRNIAGNNTYGGAITMGIQSRINSDSGTLTLSNASAVTATNLSLQVGGAGNTTISGAVTLGTGGVTKDGTGVLTLGGTNAYTGNTTVNGGTLNITGSISGLAASTNLAYGGTAGNTIVNISGSGSIANYKNFQGANVAGSIAVMNQTGGSTSTLGTGGADTQWVAQNGGYGYLNITGGTFNTGRFDAVGVTGGGTAVVYVGGGGTFNNNSSDWLILARNAGVGQLTVGPGGSLIRTAAVTANLGITMDASNAHGALNIAGGTVDTGVRPINFGFGSAAFTNTRGFVNLAGGTLSVGSAILQTNTNAGGQYFDHFNFAGGTLKSNAAITWLPAASATGHTITATIYGAVTNNNNANAAFNTQIGTSSNFTGGLTVDTNNFATTIAHALRGADGVGVTQADIGDVSLLSGNSGYIGAPSVVFSAPASPTGVPASGYAVIDTVTGKVNGIVITNPGTYAASETPTITLTGGGGTIAAFNTSALSTANTSGGLTKTGLGTLTLSGANSYSGKTIVSGGTLSFNTIANVGGGNSALGAPTTIPNGTIDLDGTLIYTGAAAATDRVINLTNAAAGSTINNSGGGLLTLNGDITGNATNILFRGAGSITMNGLIPGSHSGSVSHTEAGTLTLTNSNNAWTGGLVVSAGTVSVNNIADKNLSSAIGAGTLITLGQSGFNNTGTFQFTGASGGSSDRDIVIQSNLGSTNGGIIENTVAGQLLTLSGGITVGGTGLAPSLGLTGAGNGLLSGDISGSPALAITKSGTGTWTLTGSNTYTGTTTINQGALRVTGSGVLGGAAGSTTDANNIVFGQNLNSGVLEFETVANLGSADQIRFLNTGGTAGQGGALVYVGTTHETLGKTIQCDTSIGIRIESNSVGGSLTVNGPFSQTNRSIYLGGTGIGNNTIASAFTGTGGVTKRETGTWILSGLSATAASNYSGTTTINRGTLAFSTTSPSLTGGLTFGSANTNVTAGILDLTNASATFGGALTVNTNSATANEIKIGAAQTLTINNNVQISATPPVNNSVTRLNMTGGGVFNVTTAAAGTVTVGGTTLAHESTLDLTALSATTINTSATGTIRVNANSATNVSGTKSSLLLPTPMVADTVATATLTAGTIAVGNSSTFNSVAGQINTLQLGTGLTTLNADTIGVGTGSRDIGQIIFGGAGGDVSIRAADGSSRATTFAVGTGGATTATSEATVNNLVDFSGHDANILVTSLNVGNQARVGNLISEFKFGAGDASLTSVLDATNVNIGFRTGTATTTSVLTNRVILSGGTVTFGNAGATGTGVDIGNSTYNQAGAASTIGELNISGGNVTIHNGTGGFAIRLGTNAAAGGGTVTASLNLTGGTTTLGGDIVRGTTAPRTTSTLTLNGASAILDMGGNDIGTLAAPITLTAASGTLQNVATINGTGGLTKTTAGTLTLAGANTYTGDTNVDAGILRVNGSHTGGGDYTVASAGTLQGTGSTASALNVSGVLSPGASIETFASGTLNMLTGSTFEYEVDSSVALGLGADLQKVTGDFNLAGTVNLSIGDLAGTPVAYANGTTFSLINYTGAWDTDLFTVGGNAIADAGTFTVGLNTWQLDYNAPTGGSNFSGEYAGGSDSFVNITVIPEPSSVALLGVLGSMLLLRRRR